MSNYYKKYIKYKLKYLEAKKSMSGGGASGSASRGRESPSPSPRGMEEFPEGNIERPPSDDNIITLRNRDSGEELELKIVNELITIEELKKMLSRELNFDDYKGNIDIYMVDTILDEDDEIMEGANLDFKVLNNIPVFYDISHRADDLLPHHHRSPTNKRLLITKEEVRNIKNGDIVYTNEGNELECHIYIKSRYEGFDRDGEWSSDKIEDLFPLNGFRQYWNEVLEKLNIILDIREFENDYNTINDLIEDIYNDFRTHMLKKPYFRTHILKKQFRNAKRLNALDYRPLFLNIINWSNKEEINSFPSIFNLFRNKKNSFPNIYKALNFYMNKKKNNETDEDFLVNLKYTDIKEPDNKTN